MSIDDLFTAGLGFDLAGAVLLGRGLLLSPRDVARRSASYWDFSATDAVDLARNGFDATIGFAALALGFVCQGAAYAAVIGRADVTRGGWESAVVAIAASIAAAAVVFVVWGLYRDRLLKRQLIEIAHYDASGLRRKRHPSATRLMHYGFALGEALTSDEVGPGETRRFVQRVFGIDYAVTDDAFQDDEVAPPEAFDDE